MSFRVEMVWIAYRGTAFTFAANDLSRKPFIVEWDYVGSHVCCDGALFNTEINFDAKDGLVGRDVAHFEVQIDAEERSTLNCVLVGGQKVWLVKITTPMFARITQLPSSDAAPSRQPFSIVLNIPHGPH